MTMSRAAVRSTGGSTARSRGRGVCRRAVASLGIAAMALVPMHSASAASGKDPKQIFAESQPATVLVLAEFSATVVVPELVLDQQLLKQQLMKEVDQGKVGTTESELMRRTFELLIDYPEDLLVVGSSVETTESGYQATGSGFVIDPNGFVVTNAHVAAPSDDEVRANIADYGLSDYLDKEVESARQELAGQLTSEQFDQLVKAYAYVLAKHIEVRDLQKQFSVVLGAKNPGANAEVKDIPASVVAAGESIPGKDVAILKITGKNLPTVPLGDDTKLKVGEGVFVLGYPGAATFSPLLSKSSISEPTFTTGTMSARKQMKGGFDIIQIDSAATHGNSGGPVFNADGEVVGILTWGAVDRSSGQELQGFNFIMPMSVVQDFITRSGAKPGPSLFSDLWKKALAEEEKGNAKKALGLMQQIEALSPGHPYVARHIEEDQALVAEGKGGSDGSSPIVPIAVVAVVVLLLAGGGFVVMSRKKKGVAAGAGSVAAPVSAPVITPPPAIPQPPVAPAADVVDAELVSEPTSAVESAHRFCGSCGTAAAGGAFCTNCGARL